MAKETVYIIGAGLNQCISDWEGLNPPLTSNFFKTILKSKKYSHDNYASKVNLVYKYIEKYWKLTKEDLLYKNFNLEECFTFLQLQLIDAIQEKDDSLISELLKVNSLLKIMFVQFLAEFEVFCDSSDLILQFGKHIYKEKSDIITFNYDCNLEKAIEIASGQKKSEKGSIKYNWDYPLSYGVEFDKLIIDNVKEDKSFYQSPENKPYDWNILKLHGSLNWFKYLPIHDNNVADKAKQVVLTNEKWWFNEPKVIDGLIVDPLIIPPVLYKNYGQEIISDLWIKAEESLARCKNLIVIGYSFPPTDFGIRKLFLEAFENNYLENIIVVNPDTTIVSKLKTITHYNKPVLVCSDLGEFLKRF